MRSYLSATGVSAVLMFIFPIVMSVIHHGASTIFMTLIVLGLVLGWSGYAKLNKHDRILMIGFLVLFAVILIEYLLWPEAVNARYILKQFLRIGFASVIILFFRKYDICSAKYVFRGALVAAPIMLGVAVYQAAGGADRVHGAVGPVEFGEFAAIVAVMSLLVSLTSLYGNKFRWFGIISAVMATAVVFLSETRAALLYEIVAFLIALAYLVYDKKISWKTTGIVILGFVVVMVILSFFDKGIVNRFAHVEKAAITLSKEGKTHGSGLGYRLEMWKEAVVLWKESPVIGKGLGNYGIEAIKRRESGEFPTLGGGKKQDRILNTPHSVYFELLADTGIVGLTVFVITIIIVPLWVFFKKLLNAQNNVESMVALSGLQVTTGFVIFGITESWYLYSATVAVFLLLIISMATSTKCRSL